MDVNIVEKSKEKYLEYENRHQKILNAAIRLFSERGYAATTTAKIAKYADVNERTLYKHFTNKRDLFGKCVDLVSSQFSDLLQKQREGCPDDEMGYFQAISNTILYFVKNYPHQSRFIGHLQYYRIDPEFDTAYKESTENAIEEIEQVLNSMKKKGSLKSKINTRTLAAIFHSQFSTILFLNEFTDPKHLTEDTVFQLAKKYLEIE